MQYYTYAYLREDRTPYYIGKGKGNRAYVNHYRKKRNCISIPKNSDRILILKQNLTEAEAFRHEIYMIAVFGRKDLGTGILHNRTDGGEGASGAVVSEVTKEKHRQNGLNQTEEKKKAIGDALRGKKISEEHKQNIRKKILSADRSQIYEANRQRMLGTTLSKETRDKIGDAFRKEYKVTYDDGRTEIISGISKWCKENKYSTNGIYSLMKGKWKKHKDLVAVEELSKMS
jgi:hypothetical protein